MGGRMAPAFSMASGSQACTCAPSATSRLITSMAGAKRTSSVLGLKAIQHPDLLVLDHPQRAPDLFEEQFDTLPVDTFGLLEQAEVHPHALRQPDERLDVLGQAETAEAQSGAEELRSDARVQAHGPSHLLDVGPH